MAIFQSCCLCCNLRTGSFVSAIYSIVGTIFYLILLVIRNIGFDLVDLYEIHATLTYSCIGVMVTFILSSLLLVVAVPTDKYHLFVLWLIMAPVYLIYSTIVICYLIIYDLQNDIPVEGWEEALITVHAVNFIFMISCMLCVYSHFYDLYRGKGTAEYYRGMEMARSQALAAVMFGLDMGLTEEEAIGAIEGGSGVDELGGGHVGPLDSPAYLGVPPPAYSELSSRRSAQPQDSSPEGGTGGQSTSGTNLSSGNHTPASTVRSQSSTTTARSRPRPSASSRAPPSELSVDSLVPSTTARVAASSCMNFDLESEDGRSSIRPTTERADTPGVTTPQGTPSDATTLSAPSGGTSTRPTTLVRDTDVARIMVGNSNIDTSSNQGNQGSNSENTDGSQGNTSQSSNNEGPQSSSNSESRTRTRNESGSRSSDESRSRRNRDGSQGNNRSNTNNSRSNNGRSTTTTTTRPSGRENSSNGRPASPAPDYTLEQPSRSRRRQNSSVPGFSTEQPPPYQTLDPNRRPSQGHDQHRRPSREELEAQIFATAHLHAQTHANARADFLMRQRSREYEPGWYGAEYDGMHDHQHQRHHPADMVDPRGEAMIAPSLLDRYF